MNNSSLKIIIVDDHSLIVKGIKSILENIDFVEVIATASSGKEALDILNTTKVDILITDIEMDDIDGIELSKITRKELPLIKIIVITQHHERWIVSKLMSINVDAVILKSKISNEELLLALERIIAGKKYYSSELAKLFFQTEPNNNDIPYLTRREKEILELICKENTTKDISLKLNIAPSTIETHRKNLFTKLKVKSQSGLVREAIKFGFYNFK